VTGAWVGGVSVADTLASGSAAGVELGEAKSEARQRAS
jgi:hypothetical protein